MKRASRKYMLSSHVNGAITDEKLVIIRRHFAFIVKFLFYYCSPYYKKKNFFAFLYSFLFLYHLSLLT
jgi:hypothetical protein